MNKESKSREYANWLHSNIENFYGHVCDKGNKYYDIGDICIAFQTGWERALNSQWVIVEEKMPEKCKNVIVLHSNMVVGVSAYHCDNNWSNFEDDIIAWMPIPSFDDILEANKDVLKRLKDK